MTMQKLCKVLLIDRDTAWRELLRRALRSQPGFVLVGEADDGEEGLRLIGELKPDLVILDYLLPGADGLTVVRRSRRDFTVFAPAFLLITGFYSDLIGAEAAALQVDCVLQKPVSRTCLRERLDLFRLTGAFHSGGKGEDRASALLREITDLMLACAMPQSFKGFPMLRDAVFISLTEPDALVGITKVLYVRLAKRYETSAANVERNLRSLIASAWRRCPREMKQTIFGAADEQSPGAKEVISAFSDQICINRPYFSVG